MSSQVCEKKILNAFHKLKLQRDFIFHELEDECGFSFFVAADKPPHLRLLKLPISRVTPLALLRYITLWAFVVKKAVFFFFRKMTNSFAIAASKPNRTSCSR